MPLQADCAPQMQLTLLTRQCRTSFTTTQEPAAEPLALINLRVQVASLTCGVLLQGAINRG